MTELSTAEYRRAYKVPSTVTVQALGQSALSPAPLMNENHPNYDDWEQQVAPTSLFD